MAWCAYLYSRRYVEKFFVDHAGELIEDIELEHLDNPCCMFAIREEAERVGQAARPRGYRLEIINREIEA